ncbi:phage tail tape measure protein [Roseibium sediminis]|uniref:phage tail tape measure protein n=1 Tax=Roseibium sediminis TaxID=1775174 RepID=UPI00123E00AD|nr:phage tail tape measure protein [Roseibium sediminis]
MSDLDVKMRLDLDYRGRDAKKAKDDIEALRKAAQRLSGLGADKLEKDLEQVSAGAKKASSAIGASTDKLKLLNRQTTNKAEGELKSLRDAANQLGGKLALPTQKLKELNRVKLDRAEGELDSLGRSAADLSGKLDLPKKALRELNQLKTDKVENELRSLGNIADTVNTKLEQIRRGSGPVPGAGAGGPYRPYSGTNIGRGGSAGRFGEAVYDRTPLGAYVPLSSGTAVAAGAGVGAAVVGAGHAYGTYAGADRRMTLLGMSSGANETETRAAGKKVRALATDLGVPIESAVSGLEDIIASGVETLDEAMEMLPSTLKASAGSGTPSTLMATALKATQDQMELRPDQMMTASDTIITAGRMGKFEVEDMAAFLPNILPTAKSQLGYTGLEGLQKIATQLQVIRETSGTSGEAATRLGDLHSKIWQEETQKKYKEAGYNLQKTVEGAKERGEDPVMAAVELTRKALKKNPHLLPKLIGDKEARLGMQALVDNQDRYDYFMGGLQGGSGATEESFSRVTNDAQASIDRLSNSASNAAFGIGKLLDAMGMSGALNSIGGATDKIADEGWSAFPKAIGRTYNRYWTQPAKKLLFGDEPVKKNAGASPFPQDPLTTDIETLVLDEFIKSKMPLDGKTKAPVPKIKPLGSDKLSALSEGMGPAGTDAGQKFNSALQAEAAKAGALADDLRQKFSFTATPTINPSFSAASGPPVQGQKVSSVSSGPVNQTINGVSNPYRAASLMNRRQNREIRGARSRALHETGNLA